MRMYYVACPTESGQHTWNDGAGTTAATCTENGVMTYTCTMCSDTKTEVIPATGHAYGEPVWKWTDGFEATATFTCTNDATHVENVTAEVTSAVTTPAACETTGVRTYTAKVTFEDKEYTSSKTEVIPAAGHAYGAPVWKWTDDFTASATFTCGNDDSHVKTVNAAVTNEVTTAATCEADGVRTYTAKVTFEGEDYTDTKTEVIPALGHDYKDGKCSRCGAEEPTTPVEPGKPQQPEKPTTPDTPATGDESQLMLWVSGMLVCALGAGLMLRRKKEN